MPSSTRRARERASTRERILEAALHVLETEGAPALTIRRIAADVEYTAPVVYQHFANKDALVLELVAHGYDLMLADLKQAAETPGDEEQAAGGPNTHESDADRRLLRVASEYVRFAHRHPHLYEAMNGAGVDADGRRRAAEPAVGVLRELLAAWAGAHRVVLADPDEACEIVWGTLYGMASLVRLGTIGAERAPRLARQALGAILRGWQSGGLR